MWFYNRWTLISLVKHLGLSLSTLNMMVRNCRVTEKMQIYVEDIRSLSTFHFIVSDK
jgi:hypothetical protein